jgi:hypothetical protein
MIAGMPRMMRGVLKSAITSQEDFEFVGELVGTEGIARATYEAAVDVVIVALPSGCDLTRLRPDLGGPPHLLVTIEDGGRHAILHEWRSSVTQLGEISPDSLIAALRSRTIASGTVQMK